MKLDNTNAHTIEWLEREERIQHREVVERLDRTEQQIALIKERIRREET